MECTFFLPGPGLIFVVYPEGLAQMPAPPVWSISFFIMMLLIAFSSTVRLVQNHILYNHLTLKLNKPIFI